MISILVYILAALVIFSVAALVAAKVFLKRSWRETVNWLFEFFS